MTSAGVVSTAAPYAALADVYDTWTAGNDFDQWADDIARRIRAAGRDPAAVVLELCCGTGLMTERLCSRGMTVTGVDRSPQMLAAARRRLGSGVPLLEADLREPVDIEIVGGCDAVVCTFDSVNYFSGPGDLAALFGTAAAALAPGGIFVFDVNSRDRLERFFGNSHYGDDLGDYAYVWRNRTEPGSSETHFLITLFQPQAGGTFARSTEHHVQRWFDHDEVRRTAAKCGLEVVSVTDGYSDRPVEETSAREVWTLVRTRAPSEASGRFGS